MFAGHLKPDVLLAIGRMHWSFVGIPAHVTKYVQPIDYADNRAFKAAYRRVVETQLCALRDSAGHVHQSAAQWRAFTAYCVCIAGDHVRAHPDMVRNSFVATGVCVDRDASRLDVTVDGVAVRPVPSADQQGR